MLARFVTYAPLVIACPPVALAQPVQTAVPGPVVVVAEPAEPGEVAPLVARKLSLPGTEGSATRAYDATDVSVSVARGRAYGVGDPRGEALATLSIAGGLDEALLNWASQAGIDTRQARDLTIRSDNPGAPKVYEFEGARVLGLNISGGSMTMISLQVSLRSRKIDGVRTN